MTNLVDLAELADMTDVSFPPKVGEGRIASNFT